MSALPLGPGQQSADPMAIIKESRHALFVDQNPAQSYEIIYPLLVQVPPLHAWQRRMLYEVAGMSLFRQQRYEDAANLFLHIHDYYWAGYAYLMTGNIQATHQIWQHLPLLRQNHWGVTLYGMVTRQLQSLPTFLQIRNYLEADLCNLIEANQTAFLDNILGYSKALAQVNVESYKLIGRSLLHSGMVHESVSYLMQGQRSCPQDLEVYFHLGQYGHKANRLKLAKTSLKQCLLMSPTYTPALELLSQVEELDEQTPPDPYDSLNPDE